MPRISPTLIRKAFTHSKFLPLLLRACKTLESAEQELRWIKNELPKDKWAEAVVHRSQLRPLQYILGSQPFGNLEIKCRESVLIPRWETEEWCMKVILLLKNLNKELKILDVCTGTGCIPLLIASNLKDSMVRGLDISHDCISLANENKVFNDVNNVDFIQRDVFDESVITNEKYDFITSNPPYIPLNEYQSSDIEKSVRLYEPKLALLGENEFYDALIKNIVIPSEAKGFIFELGNESQYEHTKSLLGDEWATILFYDSNKKPRCTIGWKRNTIFKELKKII